MPEDSNSLTSRRRQIDPRLHWLRPNGPLPLYLAPMAGFTDAAFRQICKEFGADVMITEFVHAEKFLDTRSADGAWRTVDFSPQQRPMGIQIFGGDATKMAEAADRIVDRLQPDFLDINYGCPSPRVTGNCAGSSLLRDPDQLQRIAAAVVDRISDRTPVTAKIRLGWDANSINAMENARRLCDAGIAAIAIHGRTKEQGYSGDADWQHIHAVAAAVPVPVIGNGSVIPQTHADPDHPNHAGNFPAPLPITAIQSANSVSGLMIGRAALGNPWIFQQLKAAMAHSAQPPVPTPAERWAVLLRYCDALLEHNEISPWQPVTWMRARMKTFARDFPGSKALRAKIESVRTIEDLRQLADAVSGHTPNATQDNFSLALPSKRHSPQMRRQKSL